jgi:hypothetical protein
MSKTRSAIRGLICGDAKAGREAEVAERRDNVLEPDSPLPIPSPKERALLFLRAIHGERDFTGDQFDQAHSTILKAMAADIVAKSKNTIRDKPSPKSRPVTDDAYDPAPTRAVHASRIDANEEPLFLGFSEAEVPIAVARHRSERAHMSAAHQGIRASREDALPPPILRHKPAKRRVLLFGATISVCIFASLALYRTTMQLSSPTVQSVRDGRTTADASVGRTQESNRQALRTDTTVRPLLELGDDPRRLGVLGPQAVEQLQADLLERVRAVTAAGDIEAVRADLSKSAESGDASAAVELAMMYDPNILDALSLPNSQADVAKARSWYRRAQILGAPEAVGLLDRLNRRPQQPR